MIAGSEAQAQSGIESAGRPPLLRRRGAIAGALAAKPPHPKRACLQVYEIRKCTKLDCFFRHLEKLLSLPIACGPSAASINRKNECGFIAGNFCGVG